MGPVRPYRPPPPHLGPQDHNQFIKDPLAHFLAIPWTAKILSDPAAFDIVVADRRPRPSGDSLFIQSVLNSETTVRACVRFLQQVPKKKYQMQVVRPLTAFESHQRTGEGGAGVVSAASTSVAEATAALLQPGGPSDGEDPEKPFVLLTVLVELGEGMCSFNGMLHGGALLAILDEALCAAADNQSNYAFTATMATRFRKPVKLPGVVVIRARVVKVNGRKIYVRGFVENSDGDLVSESEAMLVNKIPGRGSKL